MCFELCTLSAKGRACCCAKGLWFRPQRYASEALVGRVKAGKSSCPAGPPLCDISRPALSLVPSFFSWTTVQGHPQQGPASSLDTHSCPETWCTYCLSSRGFFPCLACLLLPSGFLRIRKSLALWLLSALLPRQSSKVLCYSFVCPCDSGFRASACLGHGVLRLGLSPTTIFIFRDGVSLCGRDKELII